MSASRWARWSGPASSSSRCHRRRVAILPAGHRLARRRTIAPADFAGEGFVAVGSGTLFRSRVNLALAGIERVERVETRLSEIACVLVAEGVGMAVVDPFSAMEQAGRGVAVRPFVPAIDAGAILLRPANRPAAALAATFLTAFRADLDARLAALVALPPGKAASRGGSRPPSSRTSPA